MLVTLRLLSMLSIPPSPQHVRCICFGMPAFGNVALGEHITARGWDIYFSSYALPEDPVPRLSLSGSAKSPPLQNSSTGVTVGTASSTSASTEGARALNESTSAADAAAAAALEEELFREETAPSPSPSVNSSIIPAIKEENGVSTVQRASKWTLRGVARTAGTALSYRMPPFLSYAHFGAQLYLTQRGISSLRESDEEESRLGVRKEENAPVLAVSALGWPRNLLATHRMAAYRARTLQICNSALRESTIHHRETIPQTIDRRTNSSAEIFPSNGAGALSQGQLAPEITIKCAEMDLPAVWPPLSVPIPSPGSSSIIQTILSSRGNFSKSDSTAPPVQGDVAAYQNHVCKLTVGIFGKGLETCTGALLHLPSGGTSTGTVIGGLANQEISRALANEIENDLKLAQEPQGVRRIAHKMLHTVGTQIEKVKHFRQQAPSWTARVRGTDFPPPTLPGSPSNAEADVTVEFEVRALELWLLNLPPVANGSSAPSNSAQLPFLSLTLFSDFEKVEAKVLCRSSTVWVVSLSDGLGKSVLDRLETAARADAVDAVALLAPRNKKKGAAVSPAAQAVLALQPEQYDVTPLNNDEGLSRPSVTWREKGQQALSAAGHSLQQWFSGQPSSSHHPRTFLYRGLVIKDASPAIETAGTGTTSPLPRLHATATLLRAAAARQHQHQHQSQANRESNNSSRRQTPDLLVNDDIWGDLEFDDEAELLLDSELGLGGRLRRQLRRVAGTSAVRLRWRQQQWLSLAGDPLPQVVVILADGDMLKHKKHEFNPEMMDAVHAVAVASAGCRAATLLAVASPEARDAGYRRRLAFSCGLHGRPGAVVPLDVGEDQFRDLQSDARNENRMKIENDVSEAQPDTRLLQAALLAHAAAIAAWRQGEARKLVEDSIFRARL